MILLEYQNIKILLQKVALQVFLKTFLWLKKLKILCRGYMLLMILTEKKSLEHFSKKNYKKSEKVINYMLNGKATMVLLTVE